MSNTFSIAYGDQTVRESIKQAHYTEEMLLALRRQAALIDTIRDFHLWHLGLLFAGFSDAHNQIKEYGWAPRIGLKHDKGVPPNAILAALYHKVIDLRGSSPQCLTDIVTPQNLARARRDLGRDGTTSAYYKRMEELFERLSD